MAKVLIIDDDELICEMLSLMVEDMGHTPSYSPDDRRVVSRRHLPRNST